MDNDFRGIHNLADEGGIKTLIDVGRSQFYDTDFISVFDGAEGHVERAFIAFLKHPEAFAATDATSNTTSCPLRRVGCCCLFDPDCPFSR